MAITNICPLTGISTIIESTINLQTTFPSNILTLSIPELNKISYALDTISEPEAKLLFVAYALQAKLLVNKTSLFSLPFDTITTYLPSLKSLATFIHSNPSFLSSIPKYAHHSDQPATSFSSYLELLLSMQADFSTYRHSNTSYQDIDKATSILGWESSKYQTALALSTDHKAPASLSRNLLTALSLPPAKKEAYHSLLTKSVPSLKKLSSINESTFNSLINLVEDWDTSLPIKFAMLPFLRDKLLAYTMYSGRSITQVSLEDIEFLLLNPTSNS